MAKPVWIEQSLQLGTHTTFIAECKICLGIKKKKNTLKLHGLGKQCLVLLTFALPKISTLRIVIFQKSTNLADREYMTYKYNLKSHNIKLM